MNREAITVLERHKAHWKHLLEEKICDKTEGKETIEAFDMAISALSENKGDLISRQAVLDIWHTRYSDIRVEDEEIKYKKIAFELPSVENKGEWIPVSERLPEKGLAVLIWCPERKNIYCAYLEGNQWWIFGAYFQKVPLEVIAWQPLPEPYKAEKGGEE